MALKLQVRSVIGGFATPDVVILTSGLPKTRSGKIMRRLLRKIAAGEADSLGDTSTLAEPGVLAELAAKIRSDAIDRYALLAKAKDPNAVKWFADKGWEKNSATEKKDKRGKGRPSNEDVKGALKNIAQEAYDEKEALRRMGLLDEGT